MCYDEEKGFKLVFIAQSTPLVIARAIRPVAISCMAVRCGKMLINIVNLGFSMLIGV